MILPPRPENHRRLDPARSPSDRPAAVLPLPPRDSPRLDRFAPPPWEAQSPERLAIDDDLPADHLARAIDAVVDRLDLTALFASYAGVGSQPHRPDLMLKIVLYEMQTGRHSPGQWAKDTRDRRTVGPDRGGTLGAHPGPEQAEHQRHHDRDQPEEHRIAEAEPAQA